MVSLNRDGNETFCLKSRESIDREIIICILLLYQEIIIVYTYRYILYATAVNEVIK